MGSPKLLVPAYCIDTLGAVTATPVSHGAIVATQELRAALDTDPNNFTKIWTGSDQPIVWNYSDFLAAADFVIGDLISLSYRRAMYLRIESSAFDILGSDYNYAEMNRSDNGSSWTNYGNLALHGDGTAITSPSVAIKFNTAVDEDDAQMVMYSTTQAEHQYYRLIIKTENSNVGANYKVFDVINGYLFTLPNALAKAISTPETNYGGEVDETPFGKLLFRGVKGGNRPKNFTLIFSEISTNDKETLFWIFCKGRGNYPMLYMHNVDDKSTWVMCRMVAFRPSEPNAGLFQVEIDMEEF